MLILTRKIGESIMIGDEIEVKVTQVKGKKIRLGIKAPLFVPVNRKEIYEAIQKENLASTRAPLKVDKLLPLLKS